jgi:hypothetical protein
MRSEESTGIKQHVSVNHCKSNGRGKGTDDDASGRYFCFYGLRNKNQLKREYVAEIAASLGFSAAGNNDKVG